MTNTTTPRPGEGKFYRGGRRGGRGAGARAPQRERIVVSAAAGGVGHLAGQPARIAGARVIGITGSDELILILEHELGLPRNGEPALPHLRDGFAYRLHRWRKNVFRQRRRRCP